MHTHTHSASTLITTYSTVQSSMENMVLLTNIIDKNIEYTTEHMQFTGCLLSLLALILNSHLSEALQVYISMHYLHSVSDTRQFKILLVKTTHGPKSFSYKASSLGANCLLLDNILTGILHIWLQKLICSSNCSSLSWLTIYVHM